jgi:hypothetical protein
MLFLTMLLDCLTTGIMAGPLTLGSCMCLYVFMYEYPPNPWVGCTSLQDICIRYVPLWDIYNKHTGLHTIIIIKTKTITNKR